MKANELMIGDWVKFPIGTEKIIDLPYIEGRICASFAASATLFPVEVAKLEPIPLTPEILEKNKMRVFEHRNPWQEEAKNLIKKWYSKDGKFYVSHYRVGGEFTYTVGNGVSRICSIRYVHELQHALRILRIEKEIEL